MCYSTLLVRDDQHLFTPDQLTVTPTGAAFVKPSVRPGVVPGILAALIIARTATREQLKQTTDPARRAVLDARQRALKVTANAAYGFTGAQASPLQCVSMADSCLAYGAQACRWAEGRGLGAASGEHTFLCTCSITDHKEVHAGGGCRQAMQVLQGAAESGALAPYGNRARVIYGHTDSLFVLLPEARDPLAAIQASICRAGFSLPSHPLKNQTAPSCVSCSPQAGRRAAEVVSSAFPVPMEMKFERVCLPLLLLHVNR